MRECCKRETTWGAASIAGFRKAPRAHSEALVYGKPGETRAPKHAFDIAVAPIGSTLAFTVMGLSCFGGVGDTLQGGSHGSGHS